MASIFELKLFVNVARLGSLSAAARNLNVSPAAASLAVKRMEDRLQTQLFIRSTRNLRLTEAGARYLDKVLMALDLLEEGERNLRYDAEFCGGTLNITAPSDLARNLLLPCLDELKKVHPEFKINLLVSDRIREKFKDAIDIWLRLGLPTEQDVIALPIWENNYRVACASPTYITREGPILHPEELSKRCCITYQLNGEPYESWRFVKNTNFYEVKVKSEFVCDDGDIARRWALDGHGIIYKSWLDVSDDIKNGRLCHLLPDWQGVHAPLYLLCNNRQAITQAIRQLLVFLRDHIERRTSS